MVRRRNPGPYDDAEVRELLLWQENEEPLYRMEQAIRQNLARKMTSAKYDHSKAPAAWKHLVEATSKSYKREFGYGFSPQTKKHAAQFLADDFQREVMKEMGLADLMQTARGSRRR
jgi:hypothetical protein